MDGDRVVGEWGVAWEVQHNVLAGVAGDFDLSTTIVVLHGVDVEIVATGNISSMDNRKG